MDELLADDGTAPAPAAAAAAPAPPASPARAEPHDATAWLPLPEMHELPSIDDLLTPTPGAEPPAPRDVPVGTPSPARAEPHDATAWLPLPETDALPHMADIVAPERAPAARRTKGRHRRPRVATVAKAGVVLAVLAGTFFGVSYLLDNGTDVEIRVDGTTISVETGVSTVGSVLDEAKVELGEHDRVVPAGSSSLDNGMTVRVLRAFPVNVDVDGVQQSMFTTYRDPKGFLRDLALPKEVAFRDPPKEITENATLALRTTKVGSLFVDGTKIDYSSPSLTVRELVDQYVADGKVAFGPTDFTTPPLDEELPLAASVTIIRVATDTEVVDEPYDVPDEEQPDPNLEVGQTREQARVTGLQRVTYTKTLHDGQEAERVAINKVPLQPAVPYIKFYGTHYNPLWDKMAQCETGGNWAATGQMYQGGVGIFWKNWNYYGGREFAPIGGQATKLEQIIVAERIRAEHGWRAWGCAKTIGL